MPFIPDHVILEHSTGGDFRLVKDLSYQAEGGKKHTARADLVTDMASVPPSLWSIIAPFGEQSLPSILHDQECKDLRKLKNQRSRLRRQQRREIDSRYYETLLEQGVPRFRATMMWTGVSVGRFWEHGGQIQRIALLLQLALGYVAIVWGALHIWEPMGLAVLGAPVLAALAWGQSSPAILFAQYPGLGFLCMSVVAFVLSVVDWVVNIIFGARLPETARPVARKRTRRGGRRRGGRRKAERTKQEEGKRPFRGVGGPKGLRILPR